MIGFSPKKIIFSRLEDQMVHLVNTINDKNEKTLPTHFLTIPDSPNYIDRNQESWCLGDFNKIQFSHTNLNLINPKPFMNWQVFTSKKLNLIVNVTPIPNFVIQF